MLDLWVPPTNEFGFCPAVTIENRCRVRPMHPASAQSEDPQPGGQTMEKHTRSRMSLSRSVEDVTRNPLCEWQETLETPPTKRSRSTTSRTYTITTTCRPCVVRLRTPSVTRTAYALHTWGYLEGGLSKEASNKSPHGRDLCHLSRPVARNLRAHSALQVVTLSRSLDRVVGGAHRGRSFTTCAGQLCRPQRHGWASSPFGGRSPLGRAASRDTKLASYNHPGTARGGGTKNVQSTVCLVSLR